MLVLYLDYASFYYLVLKKETRKREIKTLPIQNVTIRCSSKEIARERDQKRGVFWAKEEKSYEMRFREREQARSFKQRIKRRAKKRKGEDK